MFSVHGLTRSYFTRKVTGFLDYTERPWRLEPGSPSQHEAAAAAGWNGGIPVVTTPDGVPMWDSTAIIEYLDVDGPRSVLPDDPTMRFLAYLLDDFSDEWFYRPAVGSRWSYEDNTIAAGWQIAQELSVQAPFPATDVRAMVVATMRASLERLGVDDSNIDSWMDEVVTPWFRVLDAHLGEGYLFGDRPSIADFAVFGANEAHFVGDPYCRARADVDGPAVVAHTHRLVTPWKQTFGEWDALDDRRDTLVAVVAEMGRHYLPWVSVATVEGSATVAFDSGATARIESTPFLDQARGIMLARYVAARSPELDAVLEDAGVLRYFADHVDQATTVPVWSGPPQPSDNRPYSIE